MALLDFLRNFEERTGRRIEENIGGLLGEDLSKLPEAERKAIRRQMRMRAIESLGSLGSQSQAMADVAEGVGKRLETRRAKERQAAAEALIPQITGRLFGGAPAATMPEQAEDGLTGVNVQSRYRQDPADAMRMMMGSQAGRDLATLQPDLAKLAQEGVTGRTVGGAVYNPLTGQFTRPPEEKKPVREIDLGNRVRVMYSDGTFEDLRKGLAPSAAASAAAPKDLSKDERDRIFKARDRIASSSESIAGLSAARQLSGKAYEGPLAATRAQAAAALPDSIEPAGAKETIEFDMILKQQVLPQLKTIFGAAPTEGERKILLELQGSSSLPRAVRNKLLDNAIAAAERRMQQDQEEVESIIGGTYFKTTQRGGPSAPAVPKPTASPKVDYIFRNGRLVKAE